MTSRAARVRTTCSRTASRRSQSTMRRWTSGRGWRLRSGRGGKRPARPAAPAHPLALLELLPDQEAVCQHDQHAVAVEPCPQPALILVPAQQPLGLLVELLDPIAPVRVLHHPLHRHLRAEVAPVVAPLAVAAVLADQPAYPPLALRGNAPAAQGHHPGSQPALAALAPADYPPEPLATRGHPRVRPLRLGELPGGHAEVAADSVDVTLLAQLQARQEIGVVAVVAVGGHTGVADAQFSGAVEQVQGDLLLGLELDVLGDVGLLSAGRV